MAYTRTCPICGTEFTTSDHRKTYCTRPCYSAYLSKHHRRRVDVTCDECGKTYNVVPSSVKTTRFCSKVCKSNNRTSAGIMSLICRICGNEFERRASRLGDCCSYECQGLAKRSRVDKTCVACGKAYEVITSQAETSVACSSVCRHAVMGDIMAEVMRDRKQTKPERATEDALNELGIVYHAEHPIGPFLIDFFIPTLNTALEVDGVYWHSLPENVRRDKAKNAYLKKCGYRVVRVTDLEVMGSDCLTEFLTKRLQVL